MLFVTIFSEACCCGWTTTTLAAYFSCILLSQGTGAIWYSDLLFAKLWLKGAFPDKTKTLQSDGEWKQFMNNQHHANPHHAAYASSMIGSAINIYAHCRKKNAKHNRDTFQKDVFSVTITTDKEYF